VRPVYEFLQRHFLLVAIAIAAVSRALRLRAWAVKAREIVDPDLTPDWSDRKTSSLFGRAHGSWQGRPAEVRRARPRDRSGLEFEITLDTPASGELWIERGDVGVLQREIRLGVAPRITPMNPDDARELSVRASDRSLPERLLADRGARAALRENLLRPGDLLTLRYGRFRVIRRIDRDEPAAPAVRAAWALLKEAARVLG
jgi:hypothetical protein